MAELSVGSTVAGCRIEGIAGRGGMGVVYRATQLALERPVALKLIAAELTEDLAFRERFKRESMIAAAIEHPNVIPVYEAGERDDELYIIMRYVEGIDLRALLVNEGPLEPQRAADLLSQVAAALGAAHRRGLVHRDVKPANVLIARDEDREHVYLTDFGIARHVASVAGVTRTGAIVGTIDYLAPERIEGDRGEATADVYALGCMLYETLTGGIPYPRDTDVAKIYAHLNAEIPSIGDVRPDLPPDLQTVVHTALEKEPARRYDSSGEFGRAVLAAAADARPTAAAPVVAPPPTPATPPARRPSTDETTDPSDRKTSTSDGIAAPPPPPPPEDTAALEPEDEPPREVDRETAHPASGAHPPPAPPSEEIATEALARRREPPSGRTRVPLPRDPADQTADLPRRKRPKEKTAGAAAALIVGVLLLAGVAVAAVLIATSGGEDNGGGTSGFVSTGPMKNLPAIPVGGRPDGLTIGAGRVWAGNGPQRAVNVISL